MLTKLTREEFLGKFDDADRLALLRISTYRGVTHLVLFENTDSSSPYFGAHTPVLVGPDRGYRTLAEEIML